MPTYIGLFYAPHFRRFAAEHVDDGRWVTPPELVEVFNAWSNGELPPISKYLVGRLATEFCLPGALPYRLGGRKGYILGTRESFAARELAEGRLRARNTMLDAEDSIERAKGHAQLLPARVRHACPDCGFRHWPKRRTN
jgi:hypothetical protein